MTHLRQLMLEELERRNYGPEATRSSICTVDHFARHFHRATGQLGPEHIRQYQELGPFSKWGQGHDDESRWIEQTTGRV